MERERLCKIVDKLIGERECSALGKTFKTQNNKYFYDTGTGKVLQCNDNVYQILRCLEKNNSTISLNTLDMPEEQFCSSIEEIIKGRGDYANDLLSKILYGSKLFVYIYDL